MSNKMLVQGKFRPKNPNKYKGDPSNIIYRSSWELTVFKYLDSNPAIIQWASEEFFVPYRNPMTNRIHRYFPYVYLKYRNKEGTITETVWEVKPKKQTQPPRIPKRKTKSWRYNAEQYVINEAKWSACKKYCNKRGYNFQIITEDVLKHWATIPPLYYINSNMSSSLQRLRNRITGNIFGTTRQSNPIEKPDLSRGAQNNSDTSHLNLDGDPYAYAVHQYPEDLGNNDFGHYILFHIFERKNSRYVSPTKSFAARKLTGDNAKREAEEGITFSSQTANSGNIIPEDKERFNMTADERPGYSTSYNLREEQFIKSRDTVALYLPPNLSVSYSHDYKNSETGLAGLVAQTAGVLGEGQSLRDYLAAQGGEENAATLASIMGEIGLQKGALKVGEFVGLGEGTAQLNKI